MINADSMTFCFPFSEREMSLLRMEGPIISAKRISMSRHCAPGCSIQKQQRIIPFKNGVRPVSGGIPAMDAGGAENAKVRKRPPEKEMERKAFIIGSDNNKKGFR